jgi:hypothetical protein
MVPDSGPGAIRTRDLLLRRASHPSVGISRRQPTDENQRLTVSTVDRRQPESAGFVTGNDTG